MKAHPSLTLLHVVAEVFFQPYIPLQNPPALCVSVCVGWWGRPLTIPLPIPTQFCERRSRRSDPDFHTKSQKYSRERCGVPLYCFFFISFSSLSHLLHIATIAYAASDFSEPLRYGLDWGQGAAEQKTKVDTDPRNQKGFFWQKKQQTYTHTHLDFLIFVFLFSYSVIQLISESRYYAVSTCQSIPIYVSLEHIEG